MLYPAFFLGFLGSLHCLGMCGPIALLFPAGGNTKLTRVLSILTYHLGRIFTYTIIGFFAGLVGKSLSLFVSQQFIAVLSGLLILFFAFSVHLKSPIPVMNAWFIKFNNYIRNTFSQLLKQKSFGTLIAMGMLNGLLPCGLVYAAVFGSLASQHQWEASAFMVVFGLGTLPMMFGLFYFSGLVKKRFNSKKLVSIFVAIIGILFILRGLGLGIPFVSPAPSIIAEPGAIDCH